MQNRLLIYSHKASEYETLINSADLVDLTILTTDNFTEAAELADKCNILLGEPDKLASLLPHASNLQWAQSTYAGVDLLCQPQLRKDYVLTGVKDIFGPLMSEYVLGQIIARERDFFTLKEAEKEKSWQRSYYRNLSNLTMGICGLGSIGIHIARTAKVFGMRVTGYTRSKDTDKPVDHLYSADQFSEFLADLDYLVLAMPHTPQTAGMFNRKTLKNLKDTSVIINIGRGSAIVEDDLIEALQEQSIGGAILDVFEKEPLPPDSPLWSLKNVTITPHVSAVSFPEDISKIFVENYDNFIKNRPLNFIVDFEKGY